LMSEVAFNSPSTTPRCAGRPVRTAATVHARMVGVIDSAVDRVHGACSDLLGAVDASGVDIDLE
jgi:hypothetical protein